MSALPLDEALRRLESLVGPGTGLLARCSPLRRTGDAGIEVWQAVAGRPIEAVRRSTGFDRSSPMAATTLDGAGTGYASDPARVAALAEALERYASAVWDERQVVSASADALPDALDLATLPRCSERELAHPDCPVVTADPRRTIRWFRGASLTTGRPTWLPLVLTHLFVDVTPDEGFTLPISTGCAAHSDPWLAVLGGLCEVIERDAIALTWLQRLPLRPIALDVEDPALALTLERRAAGAPAAELFDATTDVGIPTIYGVERGPLDTPVATLVMAATDLDPAAAAAKALKEGVATRAAVEHEASRVAAGEGPSVVSEIARGAAIMGDPGRRDAFAFLDPRRQPVALSTLPRLTGLPPRVAARTIVRRLRQLGMEAFVADLTPPEAREIGFWVVRVIVPGLLPLTFSPRAQFRGHPRLYEAPAALGLPVHREDGLNPDPQPFA